MTYPDQLVQLKELGEVRKNIHSLCSKAKCPKYPKCKKHNNVCTSDDQSQQRILIRNNGGNFNLYLRLRTELMEINYPLVISQAHKIGGYSTDDLCQEGILGLCEAIDRFDISFGTQFSTFAYHYIKKSILDFIKENHTVKLATRISYLTKLSEEAFDSLVQKHPTRANYITEKDLCKEVTVIRKRKKMTKMKIRPTEMVGHLSRMQLQLSAAEIEPLQAPTFTYQEERDSFFDLLNKELESDMEKDPIWVSEAVKLRFGLGSYQTPTPVQEIAAGLGMVRMTVDNNIKKYFERES